MAENQCCVTGNHLRVGGGRTRGSREGRIERGTRAGAEEGCFGESKRRVREKFWMNKVKMKSHRKVIGSGRRWRRLVVVKEREWWC